jgi:serine/threonine protein kinase
MDGHIQLTDFGLAKMEMAVETTTETFCGTAEYMSPVRHRPAEQHSILRLNL